MAKKASYNFNRATNMTHLSIDPYSNALLADELFSLDSPMNRDDCLLPFHVAASHVQALGHSIGTLDHHKSPKGPVHSLRPLHTEDSGYLEAAYLMEPPVVQPWLYRELPGLAQKFNRVYLYNTVGDGYALNGIDDSCLRKLWYPVPWDKEHTEAWGNTERTHSIALISANKRPRSSRHELYSERLKAMAQLQLEVPVQLYGHGWDLVRPMTRGPLISRSSLPFYWPVIRNRRMIKDTYAGPVKTKASVYQKHRFALCIENMTMKGYVTEKIFDALYAGSVPIYLGAPDIEDHVPADAFINARNFSGWKSVGAFLSQLHEKDLVPYREAGRRFLRSKQMKRHNNFFADAFCEGLHPV